MDAFTIKHHQRMTLTMQLLTTELSRIQLQIDALKRKGPSFFEGAIVILDCQKINQIPTDFFENLRQICRQHQFTILGIIPDEKDLHIQALSTGLTLVKPSPPSAAPTDPQTKIISRPVRSGQQIVAEYGDLIIIGSVSAGAELLASGNVHVYGTLRGKALAGIHGNESTQIFCQQLEAELIAIAGTHHLTAQMPTQFLEAGPVHILHNAEGLQYHSLQQSTPHRAYA